MARPKMPSHRTTFIQSARIIHVPKLHCKAIFKGVIVLLTLFLVTLSDWGRGNATQAAQKARRRRGFVTVQVLIVDRGRRKARKRLHFFRVEQKSLRNHI